MKKTLILTSLLLAFFCVSCDDELLDPNVVLEQPTSDGGNTDGDTNGDPSDDGNNDDQNNGSALSVYSLDTTSNVPFFGEIIINSDFIINNGIVLSLNIETTLLGSTVNAVSIITRDGNGRIIQSESMPTGSSVVSDRTTITYTGDNITQIAYEDISEGTDSYTYTFAYTGNTVTRTDAANGQSAVFTFDTNSRLIAKESFTGTTSTQLETLTYANGNCTNSTLTGDTNVSNTFVYDTFTNPLKAVFNDQILLTILDSDQDDEIGSYLATFYSTNNWTALDSSDGMIDFNVMYNTNNDIISRNAVIDLGDGVDVTQSEAFQY